MSNVLTNKENLGYEGRDLNLVKEDNIVYLNNKLKTSVSVIKPKSFKDVTKICDSILNRQVTILNLNEVSEGQRFIDFVSGTCYSVGATIEPISKGLFAILPSNVELEIKEKIKKKSILSVFKSIL